MKYKILLLILFLSMNFSCKNLLNLIHFNSYGTLAVIEIRTAGHDSTETGKLKTVLDKRFFLNNIFYEYETSKTDNETIIIRASNYKNKEYLSDIMTKTGLFDIRIKEGKESFFNNSNDRIADRTKIEYDYTGRLSLGIELLKKYKKDFGDFTGKNTGKLTEFILDEKVLFEPVIREKISDGLISLSLNNAGMEELNYIKTMLDSGPLPFEIKDMKVNELRTGTSASVTK